MTKGNVSLVKHNELMSEEMHKKVCRALNYFEYFLIFISAVSECVLVYAFASLVVIPINITDSAVELKICTILAGIKKHKSIIEKIEKSTII